MCIPEPVTLADRDRSSPGVCWTNSLAKMVNPGSVSDSYLEKVKYRAIEESILTQPLASARTCMGEHPYPPPTHTIWDHTKALCFSRESKYVTEFPSILPVFIRPSYIRWAVQADPTHSQARLVWPGGLEGGCPHQELQHPISKTSMIA